MRSAVSMGLTVCLLLTSPAVWAQNATGSEYHAKARFLAFFPSFIEWPGGALPSGRAPLRLCIFGAFSFGSSLSEEIGARAFSSRPVEIRLVHKEQELPACHILFVSRTEAKRYGEILAAVRGASVLTVGETPDFLANGGAISFLVQEESLRFDVNLPAAEEAHLKISSRLLALARHVITKAEAAKG